mgnify:CR=1 FL=1
MASFSILSAADCISVSFFFFVEILLGGEILNARTSILELGLAVVTLICLVMEVVLTTVEISPKFRGPEHFNTVCLLASFVFYTPAMIFRFYAMGKLVDRGLKVVEIEERGEKKWGKKKEYINIISQLREKFPKSYPTRRRRIIARLSGNYIKKPNQKGMKTREEFDTQEQYDDYCESCTI